MSDKKKHIAVLMGGFNSEREVSLSSGNSVYEALKNLGYEKISKIDFSRNIIDDLNEIKPDIIFNALHGSYGEDGRVQGLLDIIQIPYTHSGVSASAICMDKILCRQICSLSPDVNIPSYDILNRDELEKNKEKIAKIGKPFVIKPISDGSSVGVEIILENDEFNIEKYDWKYGDEVIIERYLSGKEIEVAVLDDKALGAIEIRPKKLFYDYECKYTPGMSEYIMPAQISDEKYQEVLNIAKQCYNLTNCSGIARIDFILNDSDQKFYLLEANTHPGFTDTSLVPKIAKYKGISYEDLVEKLIETASC